MGNVIKFPSKSSRDRAEIERAIRAALHVAGRTTHFAGVVLEGMSEFLGLVAFELSVPVLAGFDQSFQLQLDAFTVSLQKRIEGLMIERMNREIYICAAAGVV